ncbi:penicillin-binding protein activator [Salmonella enterica subsp. enterica serovar Montevideo]
MQQSADDSKTNWQLLAIHALLKEGKSQQAVDLFNQLPQNLNDTQRREQSLLAVEIKLAQKDVAGAQAALHLYRTQFKPSARLEKPYAMVCINIIAADSNRDAEFLFTSMQQAFVKLRRGETGQLPPPIENMETFWSPSEQYGVQQALSMSLVGDKAKVRHGLESILRETQADEIMVNGQIFDHQARLHSFDLAMDVKQELLG